MTQLAERVAYDPTLLADVARCGCDDGRRRRRRRRGAGAGHCVRLGTRAALADFLGTAPDVELPDAATASARAHVSWDEPWSVMLHDALRVLSGGSTDH